MTNLKLTIIALALCLCIAVPASAMWNNGNWIPDNSNDGYNVHFDPKTGVTSKYRDNNPVLEIKASENGNGGIAEGSIRAGYSTLSDTIYVRNVLQDKNTSPMVIKVNPDAKFRIPEPGNGVLAPGRYAATLDNYDISDETVEFDIAANQQGPTYIAFNGQAASASTTHIRSIEIVRASYGATNEVCEQVTVRGGNYDRHCEHTHHGSCSEWDYEFVGMGNGDYIRSEIQICHSHWPSGYHCHQPSVIYTYVAPTTGPVCHTEGSFITVTSIVQSKVSNGALHLIADYPNQGYNAMFTDPAPGIFKSLSVDYKIDGGVTVHKVVAEDVDLNI